MDTTQGGTPVPPRSKLTLIIAIVVVIIVVVSGVAVALYYQGQNQKTSSAPKKVTISVWDSSASGGESTAFNTSVALFEAQHSNITLDITHGVAVGTSNFATDATSHTAPNVYRDSSDNGGALYSAGLVVNLSQYLGSSFTGNFTTGTISDWTLHGALYGVPVNTNGIALYYNKLLVPNPPKNTYQMIQDALNVTHMGSSYLGLPYAIGATYGYRFATWYPAFGGELFNTSGYPELNSSHDIAAMSFVWNWTKVYGVDKAGLSSELDEQTYFEGNYSAFMLDGPWDQSTYMKYLGNNLGVAAIPFDNHTGKWPLPLWGSIGYLVSNHAASGASSAQVWASVQFVKAMTNYTAQLNLFNKAGDFPSLNSVGSYISAHPGNDPLVSGWIAQEQHTQKFPNIPQMAFYWNAFHIGASNLEQNSTTVTPTDAMNQIESQIISALIANNVPYDSYGFILTSFSQGVSELVSAGVYANSVFVAVPIKQFIPLFY
ncbi:MAG: extracellular solute-binding protein [Candidatus Thermoplasmatota archaeon]|nr:extracellular solute-binding protein [Candidatus Thermoplasmatota archaeon]MCL5438324.1 extracellular solute-binding protein [Candidatus Thermoplasmatota archaeon]